MGLPFCFSAEIFLPLHFRSCYPALNMVAQRWPYPSTIYSNNTSYH